MIQIHQTVYLIAALLLLILPFDWLAAVVMAACVHELCHMLSLYVLGGKIIDIKVLPAGCVIETEKMDEWKQFISILAGPAGSFTLTGLCNLFPKIAICGFFHGMLNLIPVLPLDGGRLVRLILYRFCPKHSETILVLLSVTVHILFSSFAIVLFANNASDLWTILVIIWNIKFLSRKIPCKQSEIGVQ